MRHRIGIAGQTGLGNSSPMLMDNEGKPHKRLAKEAVRLFFSKWGGFDYGIKEYGILMGIEPGYQYEHLKVVFLAKNKEDSYIEHGVAWGSYGSEIASTRRYYRDYKYKSKFIKFVDKFHNEKMETKREE